MLLGRALLRYRSGAWAFSRGHVKPGETFEQTAVREVQEAAGVRADILAALPTTPEETFPEGASIRRTRPRGC